MIFRRSQPLATGNFPATWEWVLGWAILLFLAYLRYRLTSQWRVDSDEPQHLHLVWSWTRGLLPYRDIFDNHTPLFHILYAPVLAVIGERPDILVGMRLAQFPLFFGALWAIYVLGKVVYDQQTGWWAMILTACEATFFFTSLEFRADTLWLVLWLATLLVLLKCEMSVRRLFFAGLLLGAAICTSIKTALLIAGFGLGAGCWLGLHLACGGLFSWKRSWLPLLAFAVGSAVLPLVLVSYFWQSGGWPEMIYCLFRHNVGSAAKAQTFDSQQLLFPALVCISNLLVWGFFRRKDAPGICFQRTFLFLGTVFFFGLMLGYWSRLTPVTNQNFLPIIPTIGIIVAHLMVGSMECLGRCRSWLRPLPLVLVLAAFAIQWKIRDEGGGTRIGTFRQYLKTVLALTEPQDFVMDAKGESIYRNRPYYFCLETQTRRKLIDGSLPDNIPERLIATHTTVTRMNRLPPRAETFVKKNYLNVGNGALVLGQNLISTPAEPETYRFVVAVGGRYQILGLKKMATGFLNGQPLTEAVDLAPGDYVFKRTSTREPLILLLSKATEKGYRPVAVDRSE